MKRAAKTSILRIRVSPGMLAHIEEKAEGKHRKVSELVRRYIMEGLRKNE